MVNNCSDHRAVLHNDYPTIGLLIESLSGSYQSGIWPGISEVANRENFNIVCFTGGALMASPDDPWEKQRNVLYDIAEKNGLDGIILSGTLCSYVDETLIHDFVDRFKNIPLVTLLPLSLRVPAVYVDNQRGMEELITHLVSEHKYRKFAFIKGPENNPEAEERLRLFRSLLADYQIFPSESDFAVGAFNRESGACGIDQFYGEGRKPEYDVIVCVDDETAFGAVERLRQLGYEVPEDVRVVGFDDAEEGLYITPPMTTVAQPLKELGATACELLIQRIRGNDIPFETILNTHLQVRQSCGCFEPAVRKTQIRKALIEAVAAKKSLNPEKLYEHISQRLINNLEMFHFDFPQLREIVNAFVYDVNDQSSSQFLQTIDRIGRMKILHGSNLIKWNFFFSTLWRYILSHLDRETFSFADALLHEARIIRGDLVLRAQGYRRISANREYNFIHEIGELISNTIDSDKLLQVISENLPDVGIDTFYVCYYNYDKGNVDRSRLVLRVENGQVMDLHPCDNDFKTADLLPHGAISSDARHTIVSEPLYFHDEMFGVIYFLVDVLEYDTNIFEVLGTYISNALHSGFLIGKVEKQSQILREQNNELEQLRQKEHAYLEAVKRELELGRKIQLSFLPQEIFQPDGYTISVNFTPAREVSGDFYDVFPFDDDLVGVVIADVSGKDVSAAMFMSLVKTLLRVFSEAAYREGKSPLESVAMVNEYVIKHHQQPRQRCMFVTMIFAVLKPSTGEFAYVNAGHNPALIYSDGAVSAKLSPTAPAVGLAAGLPFTQSSGCVRSGDQLYMYTDGVTEAQNSVGDFFGLDRLTTILTEKKFDQSQDVVDRVVEDLIEFTRGTEPFDDITMMSICRKN